jgi:hypothetical protein
LGNFPLIPSIASYVVKEKEWEEKKGKGRRSTTPSCQGEAGAVALGSRVG